jgi:hypothetical protein
MGLQRYGAFSPCGGGGFELRERLNRLVRRTLPLVGCVKPPALTHLLHRAIPQAPNACTRGDVTEAAMGLQRYGAFSPGGGGGFESCERLNRPVRRTLQLVGCVKPPALTHLPNRVIPHPDKRLHSRRRHRSRHGPSTIRCVFTGRWRRLRVMRAFEPPGSTHPTTRRVRQASGADAPSQPSDSPSRQTPALGLQRYGAFSPGGGGGFESCERLNRPVRRTLPLVGCVKPPALTHLPNRVIPHPDKRLHSRRRHRSRHGLATLRCVFTGRWWPYRVIAIA